MNNAVNATPTFVESDEMDEVRGSGSAEFLEVGAVEIGLDFGYGDAGLLRAEPAAASAVC